MKSIRRITSAGIFVAFLLITFIGISFAGLDYPVKPITLMVPYAPGGGSDITSRIFAEVARKYSSQPFIILNHPGASGTRCVYELTKSKPDGYTIAFASDTEAASSLHLIPTAKYGLDSYTTICFVDTRSPVVVTKGPWNTFEELVDYSRKNPGKVKAGVPGLATTGRLCGELLGIEAGVKWAMVPFQGSGPVIPALLGGHVQIAFLWPDVVMGLYKAGELKLLSSVSDKRQKILPDVPTSKECGFNVELACRHLIMVPNGVPKPIRDKLHGIIKKVVQDPEFVKRLALLSNSASYKDSETATAILKEWYKTSGKLYKMIGIVK